MTAFTDPFGHRWGLAYHVRDVPHEEIAEAVARAFGARPWPARRLLVSWMFDKEGMRT